MRALAHEDPEDDDYGVKEFEDLPDDEEENEVEL